MNRFLWRLVSGKAAQHVHYSIHAGPAEAYRQSGCAEWEKESTNNEYAGKWKSYDWNAFFRVMGRVLQQQ